MARDILNGVKPKSSYNHTSSKPYNPHYLARQFGLMQGIPFPYESFAKFDEWANLYAKELANQEMSSNKRISNFYFEKFQNSSPAIPKFASWLEAMFKKLLG